MKALILSALLVGAMTFSATAQDKAAKQDKATIKGEVEASCGQCQFHLAGGGCDLAIRVDGKSYWVEDSDINEHGDAHSNVGFCNAIRKAKVEGTIEGDKFKATKFELLAVEEKEKK